MQVGENTIFTGVKPGQLIVCWPDYITMLVVRVSTLLIIGIPCAQTQCEINPLRGNPFHLPIPTRRTFESFVSVENFCASLLAERILSETENPNSHHTYWRLDNELTVNLDNK